jgi:hypothetical protein
MTMSKIIIILCLLLATGITASAQDAVYIVDGQPSNTSVKPADILTISILDSAMAAKLNWDFKKNVTVIITKQYAIKLYQQKFSTFNKKYKEYLDQKQSDSNLAYVLNNTILNTERKSAIDELYELKPDDIKSVSFKKDSHFTTDATVIIITKDQ